METYLKGLFATLTQSAEASDTTLSVNFNYPPVIPQDRVLPMAVGREVLHVTAVEGTTATVVRGVEGTPSALSSGDVLHCTVTPAGFDRSRAMGASDPAPADILASNQGVVSPLGVGLSDPTPPEGAMLLFYDGDLYDAVSFEFIARVHSSVNDMHSAVADVSPDGKKIVTHGRRVGAAVNMEAMVVDCERGFSVVGYFPTTTFCFWLDNEHLMHRGYVVRYVPGEGLRPAAKGSPWEGVRGDEFFADITEGARNRLTWRKNRANDRLIVLDELMNGGASYRIFEFPSLTPLTPVMQVAADGSRDGLGLDIASDNRTAIIMAADWSGLHNMFRISLDDGTVQGSSRALLGVPHVVACNPTKEHIFIGGNNVVNPSYRMYGHWSHSSVLTQQVGYFGSAGDRVYRAEYLYDGKYLMVQMGAVVRVYDADENYRPNPRLTQMASKSKYMTTLVVDPSVWRQGVPPGNVSDTGPAGRTGIVVSDTAPHTSQLWVPLP